MHPLLSTPRRASPSPSRRPPPAPSAGSRRTSLVAEHVERNPRGSLEAPRRRSWGDQPRPAASPGYYLPPPGYVNADKPRKDTIDSTRPRYGGQGSWHDPPTGWTGGGDFGKNPAAHWVEERECSRMSIEAWADFSFSMLADLMPVLSHHDWSIPQAKQILAHWATLATLLAGTQATLMGYYEKGEDSDDGQTFQFVIASSCAGLFLEVYGALLAVATVVASISLQAPQASPTSSSPTKKPLSPRATAILDRLTVSA